MTEFSLVYIDDINIHTSQTFENAFSVHCNVLEFIFWSVGRMGLKISRAKCTLFARKLKFLGHQFDLDLKGTQIPDKRVESLLKMRVPVSQAELLSRIGMCNYFSSYLPQLKKKICH